MTRALPSSLLFHLAALLLIFLFGTFVDKPRLHPPRAIRVQMAQAPERRREEPPPEAPPEQPEEAPVAAPVETPAAAEPEPVPVPAAEPAARDESPPVEPKPKPKPEVRPADPQPEAPPAARDEAAAATPQVTSVTGTDQEIPPQFQYYITLLQGRVARNWNPKRLGFREGSQRACVIHFTVERDGRITRETVETPSGVSLFDQEALNAVRRVGRMPPLPAGITGQNLGVHFTFTLETGP